MPQKYLQLEDTRVYYDQETGDIRLISKDPRLKGSPFQLNLFRDSESTESIYRLLEADGLLGESLRELPELTYLPPMGTRLKLTNEDSKMPNRDTGGKNLRFLLGETYDENYLEINLHNAPHTLISGAPGSGKSSLLRSLLEQSLRKSEVIICHIDVHHPEEAASVYDRFRFQDKLSTDLEESLALLRSIEQERLRRDIEMGNARASSWFEIPETKAIILSIEEYADLLSRSGPARREIEAILGNISRFGRAVGIYLVVCTANPDATTLSGDFRANLARRILMGSSGERNLQSMVFGNTLRSENRTLETLGRGVIRTYGAPPRTFQAFAPG